MRKLILIPIVHTFADMGSAAKVLKEFGIRKLGKEKWEENQKKIQKFWDEVEHKIAELSLDFNRVRIYQDGLPCGGELGLNIVNSTAEKGSRNFQIIKKLVDNGAVVEATESAELLRKEYNYIRAIVNAKSNQERLEARQKYGKIKEELMEERDKFIAKKIDNTLEDNETGILFLGARHNVSPKLPKDIRIEKLD